MTSGSVLLRKYLKATKQRPADICRATQIDKSLLSRWLRSENGRKPNLEAACALEKLTRGAVPACSWLKEAT